MKEIKTIKYDSAGEFMSYHSDIFKSLNNEVSEEEILEIWYSKFQRMSRFNLLKEVKFKEVLYELYTREDNNCLYLIPLENTVDSYYEYLKLKEGD